MKKHIILGGAGFIGSHLCDALVAVGDHVVCYDNLTTGRSENISAVKEAGAWSSQSPAPMRPPWKRFEFMEGDVRDAPRLGWNGALERFREFDVVWNLACPASPPAYQADPIGTLMTCTVGTKNALDLARLCGPQTVVVQASTSEVYGDPLQHPQEESHWGNVNPRGPRSCYDEGKRAAEALCFDYRRVYGTDVRVARIFNTYGPRMRADDGRVVSNFIVQALRGEKLTIYGDGHQTRSFCYVSDLVSGLIALGTSVWTGPGPWFDDPINLGNPVECNLNTLAMRILELTGRVPADISSYEPWWPAAIDRRPLPVDDPCRRRPDITRALKILGWTPKVELEQGLQSTIEHFRKELSHANA